MQHRKLNVVFTSLILVASFFLFLSSDKVAEQIRSFDGSFNNSFGDVQCSEHGCATEDITKMYADYIEEWKLGVSTAFNEAEKTVYQNDDEVVGPHPDANKCICGGSGVITHGDGHTTPCPYHGKKAMNNILKDHNLIYKPL